MKPITWKSRLELPHILNERGLLGIAVEIGVHVGWHAHHLRSNWKGDLLIGIDPWKVYEGSDSTQETHDEYYEHAKTALAGFGERAKLLRARSLDVAKQYAEVSPGGLFDCVYMDGAHHYEAVIAELEAWWPLIKSGGVIAGHDHIADGFHAGNDLTAYATKEEALKHGVGVAEFGVTRAVSEFFDKLAEVSLTSPEMDGGYLSWAAVKP